MNDGTHEHFDDLAGQRLMRDLRAAARQIDLSPGSELAVVANGRRRRHRRRQATAATLVVALGGGTALVVQQLARTGESSIATDEPVTTEDSNPSSSDPTVDPPIAPATSVVDPGAGTASEPTPDEAAVPVANRVESNLVWTTVEPDSTEAVAYSEIPVFDSGLVLATAPGRSDDYVPQFWRTDDGVHWRQVDIESPFGTRTNTRMSGDLVYVVGTAPGVAADQPNPLMVAISGDDGATWEQIELPVDTNVTTDLPMTRRAGGSASQVPIDGGVLVFSYRYVELDWTAITERVLGEASDSVFDMTIEGFSTRADPNCVDQMDPVPIEQMYAPVATVPAQGGSVSDGQCQFEWHTWDDAGVPPETVEAVFGGVARVFVVRGSEATEVDAPAGIAGPSLMLDDEPLFADRDGNWYVFDGSRFQPTDLSLPSPDSWPVGSNAGISFAVEQRYPQLGGAGAFQISASDGGEWAATDWTGLVGDGYIDYFTQTVVTEAGLVVVNAAAPDPIAAAGGVEVTANGITLRRASLRDQPQVFDADGNSIPIDLVYSDPNTGGLIVRDADGATRATLDYDTVVPVFGVDSPPDVVRHWTIQTSTNGSDVAVESIADLLGIDDSDISSVPRVQAMGNTTVVAVTLKERNAEGVPRQLVLVGTPRA